MHLYKFIYFVKLQLKITMLITEMAMHYFKRVCLWVHLWNGNRIETRLWFPNTSYNEPHEKYVGLSVDGGKVSSLPSSFCSEYKGNGCLNTLFYLSMYKVKDENSSVDANYVIKKNDKIPIKK